jgi:hypothetical protein
MTEYVSRDEAAAEAAATMISLFALLSFVSIAADKMKSKLKEWADSVHI